MRLSLTRTGLIDGRALDAWTQSGQRRIWSSVRNGMQQVGARIAASARGQAASVLKGSRAANSIKHRVWSNNAAKLPGLQISSKIPWLGMHERGGVISGKMLVPVGTGRRMRRADWRRFIQRMFAEDRAFYLNRGGVTLLMVRQVKGGDRGLARFKRTQREYDRKRGGSGRIARDRPIPVAILATRVTIKKRLRTREIVRAGLPALSRAIRSQ